MQSVQALVEAGAPVNQRAGQELTALMWASGQGQDEIAQWLIARGADASLRDDRGMSAAQMRAAASSPQAKP